MHEMSIFFLFQLEPFWPELCERDPRGASLLLSFMWFAANKISRSKAVLYLQKTRLAHTMINHWEPFMCFGGPFSQIVTYTRIK